MANYMVFRSVVPPGFNFEDYAERSGEPIRFDCVTCVEAKTPREAVEAVVGATGIVNSGFAAIECEVIGFGNGRKRKFAAGGVMAANDPVSIESSDDKLARLQREIDMIRELGND